MKLIIRSISNSTKRGDLKNFANSVLKKWFRLPFSAPARIVSCRVLSTSSSMRVNQRYGLINVTPDDAALKIIRKLNGKKLKGKCVEVKRYDQMAKGSPEFQG